MNTNIEELYKKKYLKYKAKYLNLQRGGAYISSPALDNEGNVLVIEKEYTYQNFILYNLKTSPPRIIKSILPTGDIKDATGIVYDRVGNIYIAEKNKVKIFYYPEYIKMEEYKTFQKNILKIVINGDFFYVLDNENSIYQINIKTKQIIKQIGGSGSGNVQFNSPENILFDKENNIVVVDTNNHRIQVLDKNGKFIRTVGQRAIIKPGHNEPEISTQIWYPRDASINLDGDIICVANGNNQVIFLSYPSGEVISSSEVHGVQNVLFYNSNQLIIINRLSHNAISIMDLYSTISLLPRRRPNRTPSPAARAQSLTS
jgi:hypothetical protein